jgi:hypothetical protein
MAKAFKSWREASRSNIGTKIDTELESLGAERIQTGAIMRIADAVEIIAKDKVKLEQDLDWYKKSYERRGVEIVALENQIKGLKSAKSRFKNQLDKSKEKEA